MLYTKVAINVFKVLKWLTYCIPISADLGTASNNLREWIVIKSSTQTHTPARMHPLLTKNVNV